MQPNPPPSGERWNVNMPAVIGVVFVFLVGVVIWVIATSGDGDDAATTDVPVVSESATSDQPVTSDTAGTTTPATTPSTTTPPPPSTTATTAPATAPTSAPTTVPETVPTTVPPTTAPPVTAAPDAGDDAVPGDLGVPGRPMQRPRCDGSFITVLASPIGDQATASSVGAVLDEYPRSNYLRTDQTCPSLNQSSGGEPIYVIFFGPFAFESDACAARADGPEGAYARRLSDEVGSDHLVTCA